MPEGSPFTSASLWRHPAFLRLWTASAISDIGSQVSALALPLIAALMLDATAWQMGLLSAAESAPTLLVGLFVGVWVDRRQRRSVMIAADLGRAALLLIVPIASVLGVLRIELLYAVALAAGALSVLFDVSHLSYLPSLVLLREHRERPPGADAGPPAPPGHPLARRARCSLAALDGQPFIGFQRDIPTRRMVDGLLRRHGVRVTYAMELDNVETIKRSVEAGLGVSLLPAPTLASEIRARTLVARPPVEGPFRRPIGVIRRRTRELSAPARAFLSLLTSTLAAGGR